MIRIPRVRCVDENGEQLGVLETREALMLAESRGLDLVEVAPTARPPVCRFMDYGKFLYEASKKAKKARQQSHTVKVKTVKFRPKTDSHDLEYKTNNIIKFLGQGHKVKIMLQFRGREMTHMELGIDSLKEVVESVAEHGVPEGRPSKEGRTVTVVLAPRVEG
ncbi:MAG: translation initiation factor IF-3 [bacterium]|nr:translation initiation factor IF-3 [bacterium]MCP4799848.1 translation initiation factor IF-3 [bacterium]